MSGFSMADELRKQLGGVSESDTMLEVPVESIVSNPKNFYPRPEGSAMTALMESIEANGLLEPPTVVPAGNGTYRLISGHSRMAAIRQLRNLDHARVTMTHRWDRVLCRVLEPMSEEAELTAVIEANRQRVKSPALLADEAARLEAAYVKRQQAGEQLPGGIRAAVAKALQINATKVSNLKAIKAGIKVPGIIRRWEQDELPEAAALVIARMDIDRQYRLLDWIIDNDKSWSIRDVQLFDNIWTLCRHDCPDTAGLCPNAERMVRDKLRGGEFKCVGCCDRCRDRDACSTCCDFVRAKRPAAPEPEPAEPAPVAAPKEPPEGQLMICGWMPGGTTPAEPGEFAVLLDLGGEEPHRKFMRWTGTDWTFMNGTRTAIGPTWWLRLPPVPEEGVTP